MWYSPRMGHLLYATSEDGLHWKRPILGTAEFRGSKENNFLNIQAHSPSIVVNERAEDPEHRYVMFGYWNRRYITAHSPDGLDWKMYSKSPPFTGGDTTTLAQDPETGEFLVFHKRYEKHRGEDRRLVYLSKSPDMQEWSEPELVMAPDEIDDAETKAEGGLYSEFYNMSAFPYAGQWLGLVTHFRYSGRPEVMKGPAQSTFEGPIDVQLVHSRDGRNWHRLEDRSPVIKNGPHNYDAGSILGVANVPVLVGDEMWFYYTAITTTHGGHLPEKEITIALARWRLDGFVSLDAGSEPGIVETVPLQTGGGRLTVNVDASRGAFAVEVLDSEGEPLPGYSRKDCVILRSDGVRQTIRWADREDLPSDQPIRIRFHLRNARLFSYQVGSRSDEDRVFRGNDPAHDQAILVDSPR